MAPPRLPTTAAVPANSSITKIRTYWWRWAVLAIFILNQLLSNLLWITFAPIADVMRCYYDITNDLVNTLSLASAVLTLFLGLPSSWLLVHYGIRFVIVVSSVATALGGALRLMGAGSNHFYLLMIGQIVMSFNGLMSGSGTLISETWFPPGERATATALGAAIAPQVGVLLGYAFGPSIIHSDLTDVVCNDSASHNHTHLSEQYLEWHDVIYNQIFYYLLGQAILTVIALFITIAAFLEAPPTPPSLSRLLESRSRTSQPFCQQLKDFIASFLEFMRNGYFVLFLIAAGIHVGTAGTVASIINEMVLPHFKGHDRMIAYLGITMKVSSILGLLLVGRLLDWTKMFYGLWLGIYLLTAISLASFAAVVQYQHYTFPLYIAIAFAGASFSSFQVVALEYAVEMTYPLPEGTSFGLLNVVTMLIAVILMVVFGRTSTTHQLSIGTWVIVGVLFFGALLAVFVRPELKRLNIDKERKKS